MPTLEAIVNRVWSKEDDLKDLRTQLTELDKKITAALASSNETNDNTSIDHVQSDKDNTESDIIKEDVAEQNKSKDLVAEPPAKYIRQHFN